MSDEAKVKKTRKPQGPRQAKPLHFLVTATDESGNRIMLANDRVNIEVVKDPAQVIDLLINGGAEGVAYVRYTPPSAAAA